MLDDIPARAWLLLGIGVIAIGPARYVFTHISHSPRRRDITQPPEDLAWRTERKLYLSIAALMGLLGFCAFIFTPAAEAFARSPQFLPLLSGMFGLFALSTVARGHWEGTVELLSRGSYSFQRESQPKRYWASMAWNALLGAAMLWLASDLLMQTDRERCLTDDKTVPHTERIDGCDAVLRETSLSASERSDILAARAWEWESVGDKARALADYDRVIQLDNTDPRAFYNRGMLHEVLGNEQLANEDYNSAILLDPDDAQIRLARASFYINHGNMLGALNDLNRANALEPGDVWILANRGLAQAWMRRPAASRDLAAARALDPENRVMLAGEAILRLQERDLHGAVKRLDALLEAHPDDRWARGLRAELVREIAQKQASPPALTKR